MRLHVPDGVGDPLDFVALDVETANSDLASICQIGVVGFRSGSVVSTWRQLIDPQDYFNPWNIAVHGITDDAVRGAPTLPQLFPDLSRLLDGVVVACHTPFDRIALSRAAARHGLPPLSCSWLDTARVVRLAWSEYSRSGYGLASICKALQISFRHHDAAEDARAAGEVLLRAMAESGLGVADWLQRTR